MFNYEALVSLCFRLLDLCIIMGLGAFIFVRWALPNIKQEMKHETDAWHELHEKIQSHVDRQTRLQQTFDEDKDTAQRLKKQVDIWRSVIEHAKKERFKEKAHIAQHLQEKHQKKEMLIKDQTLYKEVMPEALQQAECELKAMFSDTDKAQQFIEDILAGLQKEGA